MGRRRRRERGSMVPPVEFSSYYGRPILKRPAWKSPDVPIYFWAGGVAGTTAGLAALADVTGRPTLRRSGRVLAAGSALVGTAALIHDLGRPARFLYMLRVIKPTSPLSIGTWILSPFAAMACAAWSSLDVGITATAATSGSLREVKVTTRSTWPRGSRCSRRSTRWVAVSRARR